MKPTAVPTARSTSQSESINDIHTSNFQEQTLHLLERIAQSQTALEKRLAAMEMMLSQHDTQPQAPSFPQFRQLPPELRLRIWSLVAIPSRVLRVGARNGKKKNADVLSSSPPLVPPAIAGACRESRALATKHGALVSLTYGGTKTAEVARTRCYWFDSYRDVLEVDSWVEVEGDRPRGVRDLVQRARHILVGRAEAEWYARLFERAALLNRVSLKFDSLDVRGSTHGRDAVRRMFGGGGGGGGGGAVDTTLVVTDLEDADEIAYVKSVLGFGWRNPVFLEFDLELWARKGAERVGRAVRDEKWMRRLPGTWMSEVARGWVMAKAASSTTTKEDNFMEGTRQEEDEMEVMDGGKAFETKTPAAVVAAALDVENEFVRAALLGMPEVRFVRAFCLDGDDNACHA
ncbi:hypothetical protein CORC01_06563 [Colletotrichum orchidophilum]|uniref:2EXR domain-containing protein n=1 Tax=Colletotrichum orchidophilum TaxID=1209926 RepID=A0A1G4BA61_9PEZI|nr:uncharacterized protein CORC01_06563 [Colletotrichum orchidophilum]OHE98195.1 hypothetical protein CORC01_06563 [Colletotrichum orchidophilum]